MDIQLAADALAKEMRPFGWYHRTTMYGVSSGVGWSSVLCVYAEGRRRPSEIPSTYQGYPVHWIRVTKKHPCPFGSVKA